MAKIIKGRVDILLVTCSSKILLERSINSIKSQLFKNWRLLIVNDNINDIEVSRYLEDLNSAKENIEVLGGHVTNSVSNKTNYLVKGFEPGTKLKKAIKIGVKILIQRHL